MCFIFQTSIKPIVFTQSTAVRTSSINGISVSSGSSTNPYNINGMEKTRTSQSNSGDVSSSNRPGWSVYLTNRGNQYCMNSNDITILLFCFVFITIYLLK